MMKRVLIVVSYVAIVLVSGCRDSPCRLLTSALRHSGHLNIGDVFYCSQHSSIKIKECLTNGVYQIETYVSGVPTILEASCDYADNEELSAGYYRYAGNKDFELNVILPGDGVSLVRMKKRCRCFVEMPRSEQSRMAKITNVVESVSVATNIVPVKLSD